MDPSAVIINALPIHTQQGESGITYACKYPNYQFGTCTIIFRKVSYFSKERLYHKFYPALIQEGLSPRDHIAQITMFYPYTDQEPPHLPRRREGVGSKVLEHILTDARQEDAKALMVETDSRSMKEFLAEKKFQNIAEFYYLIL